MESLIWLVVLCPLVGFLLIAFFGAGLTKSPKPVVETDAPTHASNPSEAVSGEEADASFAIAEDHDGNRDAHDVHASASSAAAAHHDPGAHGGDAHATDYSKNPVGWLATLAVFASFVLSLLLFFGLHGSGGAGGEEVPRLFSAPISWMQIPPAAGFPGLDLSFRLMVDPLTSLMTLIITGVGFLIHLYSIGYMAHDKGFARYFGYLNLFIFFMLLLVMGSNLIVLFVGWEGVGLASYLLIGFWYERKSATDAGKKAFIVNRIGDAALLIALFLIYRYFGTFEFYGENGILTRAGIDGAKQAGYTAAVTLVPLLMFLGAAGKSAQIPLYVWLPDAMEGPTPVSALIHAATMVTGGVYLVSRTHELFLASPAALSVVAIVGLATALLAATIGLVQNDIKRVLAYSTVSQLGYMFLACGVGAFGVAMFHVTTHAFFKALLFLGSGSVIHAMGGEQDMRKMGGLGTKIKTTWATMLIGTLAIAGVPPLAGFWSKDEILLNAFAGPGANGMGHPILWLIGFIVSGMTAFYMVRLMMKTFAGKARYDEQAVHVHESPSLMTLPLWILAVLSVFGGFLNAGVLHFTPFEHFLGGTVDWREAAARPLNESALPVVPLLLASAALAIVVVVITRAVYAGKPAGELSTDAEKQRNGLWKTLYNKWYVDELYDTAIVQPGRDLAGWLWRFVDVRAVDGVVNGVGGLVAGIASGIKGWQSGYVRNYALSMLIGVAIVVIGCLLGLAAMAAGGR